MKILLLISLVLYSSLSFGKLNVRSTLPWMQKLGTVSDCVIANPSFRLEVATIKKFDFSDKNGLQVVSDFDKMGSITISTYWYWSKSVIATTYAKDKTTLYLNTRANPRPMKSMINTVIHESRHLLGDGHGDNKPRGKENSIPYKLGSIAEKYVSECER